MALIIIQSSNVWSIKRGTETDKDLCALLTALDNGLQQENKKNFNQGIGNARIVIHNGKSELHTNAISRKNIRGAIYKILKTLKP